MTALYIILAAVLLVTIFFIIPYSPLKWTFKTDAKKLTEQYSSEKSGVITDDDIRDLPAPVQDYFRYCGFIGKPKMTGMKVLFKNVPFKQDKTGPSLTIDYTQYNFVKRPQRLALIESKLFVIPFDGYDSYMEGTGGMRGVIGKLITIFNLKSPDMDKACLVTFLSECLLLPSAALQDYISWTPIDDTHAKAEINYYGGTAEGVFTFGPDGEAVSFTTSDRPMIRSNGNVEYIPWTAAFGNYQTQNGYKLPMHTRALWNFPDGDLVYFDSDNMTVEYF